ncbi:MAG: hypothetical protein ACE5JI_02165 [Acidobacteriota bacterium]
MDMELYATSWCPDGCAIEKLPAEHDIAYREADDDEYRKPCKS